jgi:hypothetical protein
MTDQEFSKEVRNRPLTRMYHFCCSNEIKKLIIENGGEKGTQKRTKIIEELYEELKPAFIDFAHNCPDESDTEKLPILFSNHIKILARRKKIEKFTKKK